MQQISWQSYWTTLAIIVVLYYAIVVFLFYRNKLIFWTQGTASGSRVQQAAAPLDNFHEQKIDGNVSLLKDDDRNAFADPQPGSEEHIVYSCMDECNAFFEAAKSSKPVKKDLILSLQQILSKYPTLKSSTYKESISNVIAAQCKQNCVIHLDEEDKVLLWAGT